MVETIFRRTAEDLDAWPLCEDEWRALKVSRIYRTEYSMGVCGCCDEDAHFQIVMFDSIRKKAGDKTTLFSCRNCANLFVEFLQRFAESKAHRWRDGWEIPCDYCGNFCTDVPYIRHTKPERKEPEHISAWEGEFANTICRNCDDLEDLFA